MSKTQLQVALPWAELAGELPWPPLLAACAILTVDFGLTFGSVVIFPAVQKTLSIPGWHLAALFSASNATYLCLGLLSGPLADRHGTARVVGAGQGVLIIGLAIAAMARSEGVFDIGYVVAVGIGVGLTYVPTLTAAQLRAPGHAPLAAGIAGTGVGLGALFGAGLLGLLSNGLGWRVGLLVAGSTVVAAAVATIALASPKKKTVSHPPGVRDHYSVPAPWAAGGSAICLYAAYITIGMVAFVPFTGLIPLGREIGWRASTAIGMIGVVGAGSAVGRLVLSGVAERVGARRTSGMCGLIMGLTMALMAIASTPFAFAIPAFVFGACYGGMSALTGPTAAETFGRDQLGRSVGRMMTAWALGILTGPWLVAVASERLGEHRTTWMVCAALSVISGCLFLRAASSAIGEHQPSSS